MANVQEIKAQLMVAACVNAAASVGVAAGEDGKLAVDPDILNPELRDKNLLVYETAKIHYAALLRGFHDQSGVWPDPKLSAGSESGVTAEPGKLVDGLLALGAPKLVESLTPTAIQALQALIAAIPGALAPKPKEPPL